MILRVICQYKYQKTLHPYSEATFEIQISTSEHIQTYSVAPGNWRGQKFFEELCMNAPDLETKNRWGEKKLLQRHDLIQVEIRCKLCLLYLKQTIPALVCCQCWLTANDFSRSLVDNSGHRAELKPNGRYMVSPVASVYEILNLLGRLLTFQYKMEFTSLHRICLIKLDNFSNLI